MTEDKIEKLEEIVEPQKARLYLNMILKENEPAEMVQRSIESVLKCVDGIYITITYSDKQPSLDSPLAKLLKKYKTHISFFKWVDDFSAARNFAMDQAPHGSLEFIYWHDADDVLQGAENLRSTLETAIKYNWATVFFHYWYQVELDKDGNVREILVDHKRERIIRNDSTFKWVGMLHELLIEQKQDNITKVMSDQCRVVHLSNAKRVDENIYRNIRILEAQMDKENHKDPRTLIYLGKAYVDMGKVQKEKDERNKYFTKALKLFYEYLEGFGKPGSTGYKEGSGWPEERSGAWEHVGEIAFIQEEYAVAASAFQSAIDEAPYYPNYYIDLAMCYSAMNDIKKAKHWLNIATTVPEPETSLITTPKDLKVRALEVDYHVSLAEQKLEKALQDVRMLEELNPDDKLFKKRADMLLSLIAGNKASQSVVFLGKYLERQKEVDKIKYLLQAIPQDLQQEKFVSEMKHLFLPSKQWATNEIAILCGPGFEEWSPKSLATGLGGSEEAVVYLSKELAKLGWKVTVYANPGKEMGIYDGVEYKPYYDLNPKDMFNVMVLWRGVGFIDFEPKAKFVLLWTHDIPNNPDNTEERLAKINKIAVLSEYHKSLFRQCDKKGNFTKIPDSKFFLTSNGVNLDFYGDVDV